MTTESFKIFPLISLAHSAAIGILSLALFGYRSSKSREMKLFFEYSSKPSRIIKTSSEWSTIYSNKESSIFECSSNTEDRLRISLKVTRSSPSKFSWRKVSKYAKLKSGTFRLLWGWNNLFSAQSRIKFWQKTVFPIPAFPVIIKDLGFISSLRSLSDRKISWECSTGFPFTWPYRWSCSPLSISRSSTGFLPCCIRRLVNMSSVLTFLDEVGEATLRNSVCFLIDSFNAFVYAEAAEEETKSCVNFIIIIPFLKLLWSFFVKTKLRSVLVSKCVHLTCID